MKKFDLPIFLNKFYVSSSVKNEDKVLLSKLKCIYGLNIYSCVQICIFLGFKYNINLKLSIFEWSVIYMFLKEVFNFLLFDLKFRNVYKIRFLRNYKGWRHIFNLPVRGQRSHTNAKTRKRFKIT